VKLGDLPVDAINLLATPGLFKCLSCISFGKNFEHSTSSFMKSTFAKRQFEFVVFVRYIVLQYFILWSTLSVTNIFCQLIEYWSSFANCWYRRNCSHDKGYLALFGGRQFPFSHPRPTHLPKHEFLSPNNQFYQRIWYVRVTQKDAYPYLVR